MKKPYLMIIAILVAAVGGYIVWWLAAPLFFNQTVDESFPVTVDELSAMSAEEMAAIPEEKMAELKVMMEATAAAMPDKDMMEEMPTADAPVLVLEGNFEGADDFHKGSGRAAIYQLATGEYLLRFEEFNVINGPDLHVLLSTSAEPFSDIGNYKDLGPLKGNIGNQNYAIPADVDISQYRSVIIYCVPFHVNFASATLQ